MCSEEQPEYIGQCEECGQSLYRYDGKVVAKKYTDHPCWVRREEDAKERERLFSL